MRKPKVLMLTLAAALVAGCACFGCATEEKAGDNASGQDQEVEATGEVGSAAAYIPVEKWAELYPLQAESAKGYTVREGVKHGHYGIGLRVTAPVDREALESVPVSTNLEVDEDGYYKISGFHYDDVTDQWVIDDDVLGLGVVETRIRQSCFACKSSVFNVLYEEQGTAVIGSTMTEEFVDMVSGQVWDCGLCHADINEPSQYDTTSVMYELMSGDAYDAIPEGERVCAPCHAKYGGFHVAGITEEEIIANDPWKYGLDIDSLIKRDAELGAGTIDEATGIVMNSYAGHYDIEVFNGSNHQSLGLACVDCHMPTVVDEETGEEYTYHNASGSPLENEAAVKFCLTCHESQGITSTDQMVEMVRGIQAESRDGQAKVYASLDVLYGLIASAVEAGDVDEETLEKARAAYETAYTYVTFIDGKSSVGATWVRDGGKTVHDPEEVFRLIAVSQTMIDDAIALLS